MLQRHLALLLAAATIFGACGGSTPKSTTPAETSDGTAVPGATPASATSTDPEDAPLPLWPKVRKGVLSNGLTYYVLPHGKPEKRAML